MRPPPAPLPEGPGTRLDDPILDHPIVAARYFFPRHDRFPSPFLVEAGGARLACAFHRAGPEGLTVVHFHGNGEVVSDWLVGFPDWLAGRGAGLLLAEYRGYGMSTGEPLLGRMLGDVETIVRASGVPEERIVFFGRSVGSLFALEGVARFPRAAGLVLESAIADPLERLLLRVDPAEVGATREAFGAAVASRLDQRRKIASYRGPVLVLHAQHDDLVDVSHGERLAAWAGGPATLTRLPRGGHNSILAENRDGYLSSLETFLVRIGSR